MPIFPTGAALGRLAMVAVAASMIASGAKAHADTIVTAQILSQNLDDPGQYPATVNIGTFSFIAPAYSTLVGATVSGAFGSADNPFLTATAPGTYTVAGIAVAQCNVGDLCWDNSQGEVFWSYTFTAADFASLAHGSNVDQALSLAFNLAQSDVGNVNTDTTTLTLDFQIPEPATEILMAAGLLGLATIRRSKRA